MLPSSCHIKKRKNLRLHDLRTSGEGKEGMNPAFIYKHTMTNEVICVDIERAKKLEAARPCWKLIHSINAVEVLHFIIGLTPRQRNRYIKSLTEKP